MAITLLLKLKHATGCGTIGEQKSHRKGRYRMKDLLIQNALVYVDGAFRPLDVLCRQGKIDTMAERISSAGDALRVDGTGMRLTPGFIDAHTHGGAGVDVNAADEEGLKRIAAFFASQGTTSWLASVLTDTEEATLRAIHAIHQVCRERGYGAQLMGVHLEGPFLNPEYKGAMPEHLLRQGDMAFFQRCLEAAGENLRYVTVAPEVPGVMDLIAAWNDRVAFALGHSAATYDTTMEAIRKGARCITHTFNGMRLFHQHEPAIMGAGLESDAWCEAICDGRHLHRGTVRMLLKCKGWNRVMAVTDSIMAAGLPDGAYKLGVNDIIVENGDARLAQGGTRAGSTLTTIGALRNLLSFTGEPLEKALPLLTSNVAEALRLSDRKGRIAPHMDADLLLLDGDMNLRLTVVGGEILHRAMN